MDCRVGIVNRIVRILEEKGCLTDSKTAHEILSDEFKDSVIMEYNTDDVHNVINGLQEYEEEDSSRYKSLESLKTPDNMRSILEDADLLAEAAEVQLNMFYIEEAVINHIDED